MNSKKLVTMAELADEAMGLALDLPHNARIWGIPRGGVPAALAVFAASVQRAAKHHAPCQIVEHPEQATVLIDDIWDTGDTAKRFQKRYARPVRALFDKRDSRWKGKWLVMPWEVAGNEEEGPGDNITRLLQYIGEDPKREGLLETPARVLKAWKEWATGYAMDPADILKTFSDGAQNVDEMVIVHNIPFVSKCEHHLADVIGVAHVGYIPHGKIVGLSKLARLVDCFARRLQVQERATVQIADALVQHLQPVGVGVLVRASHACMSTRGVKVHGSVTTTSAMRGALMERGEARKEFMDLCAMAEKQV